MSFEIKCLKCNCAFLSASSKRKFCSSSCSVSFNNSKRDFKPGPKPKTKCSNCFKRINSRTKSWLCFDCQGLNLSTKSKKELFLKSKNWQSSRSSIQGHARKTFFASTETPCCKICNYSTHIEVCHIKSVSSFDDDSLISEINSLANLIALCPTHHWEFDNGILLLE